MKFSAEKAGKRAKCPKCDTIVLIPAEEKPEETGIEPAPESDKAAPEPAQAPAASAHDPDTEGYAVFTDPEIEERRKAMQAEEEAKKKKKDRKNLPKVARKVKAIADAELWAKTRLGLVFLLVGACIWLVAHLLQGSYVLLGSVEFSEYAALISTNLENRGGEDDFPPAGNAWDLDELNVYLGMITGSDFVGYARFCIVFATILYFFQAISWAIGYVIALPTPPRYGTFGQLITSLVLGFVNFIIMLVFKLLPVTGAIGYVLIPFVVPEISMTEYNMERIVPIHLMWSGAPFWETFVNFLLVTLLYLQPALGPIFIWSVARSMKDEELEASANGNTQLCLGCLFSLICYHLLSLCGASGVLVMVLRVVYIAWFCFTLLFILQYAMLIVKCRSVLYEKIYPKNLLEEEE